MNLTARSCELRLANPWKIASSEGSGIHRTVIVELSDQGTNAIGEAAPSTLYGESVELVLKLLGSFDAYQISFHYVHVSMIIESLPGIPVAAECVLNLALLDGAARRTGKPLRLSWLGIP